MICATARPAGPAALNTEKIACFKEPSSSRASDSSRASSGAAPTAVGPACVVDVAAPLASLEFGPGAGPAVASCAVPAEALGCAKRWSSSVGFSAAAADEGLLAAAGWVPDFGVPVGAGVSEDAASGCRGCLDQTQCDPMTTAPAALGSHRYSAASPVPGLGQVVAEGPGQIRLDPRPEMEARLCVD